MDRFDLLIDFLKAKSALTPLEKDILDISHELLKKPFEIESAKRLVALNEVKYNDLYGKVAVLPTTVQKQSSQINEEDLRYVLGNHLWILAEKELRILNSTQSQSTHLNQ